MGRAPLPVRTIAAGVVSATGVPLYQRGYDVFQPSDGIYDIMLDEPVSQNEMTATVAVEIGARSYTIDHITNQLKRITLTSGGELQTLQTVADYDNDNGNYRVRTVGGTGDHRFSFEAPPFLPSPIVFAPPFAVELRGITSAGAANNPTAGIDLISSYGPSGGSSTRDNESNIGATYATPAAGDFFTLDLSSVFNNMIAGDSAGVFVEHQGIGGDIDYLGVFFTFNRSRPFNAQFSFQFGKLPP